MTGVHVAALGKGEHLKGKKNVKAQQGKKEEAFCFTL